MSLYFHSKNPGTAWLSNLSPHGFTLDRVKWGSVEHWYQAAKYAGTPAEETVRRAATPLAARKAGRNRSLVVRADWEAVKEETMREGLRAKFTQNRQLRERLLATGEEELVHESSTDLFWGRDGEGAGENRLGIMLMEIRAEIHQGATWADH